MRNKIALFSHFSKDFKAGLIVFLIALPLCLGIAQASHAPLFAGLVAGIIGGIVVGSLSKSSLSVTGPAAGLTAIVFVALHDLGAFNIFLCAVIIAGAIQYLLGLLKAGSIASYFPSSVIEGMLAGIGLTIIIKQIPDAIGYAKDKNATMADADDGIITRFITDSLSHIEPVAVLIAVVGLGVLILWQTRLFKKLQLLPAGLVVVVLGIIINELFRSGNNAAALDGSHLVSLPIATSASGFFAQFTFPDFSGFLKPKVWEVGAIIAIVASIETLLCIEATDQLDPAKRYTPTNRELKAQGIGNMLSGLIGGLPVTSVIVRSSANINAGARSKLSTIIHGTLLLLCVASIPMVLNMIPKAALAAILIFTGYRLCKPSVFKHMWKEGGMKQFLPFILTAVAVVSLDLLKGVGIGLIVSIFYILQNNMRIPYYFKRSGFSNGELIKLTLAQEVSFLNKASIKATLENLPHNSTIIIDASETKYIDFDVLDLIRNFYNSKAPDRNIKMSLIGFKNTYKLPEGPSVEEVLSPFSNTAEVPQRSAGNHKKLLNYLEGNKTEQVS